MLKDYYEQLRRLIAAAEMSEQEGIEIIAELKAENVKLKAKNVNLKEALEKIKMMIEPCKASDSCFTCKYDFCANYELAKIIKEVSE